MQRMMHLVGYVMLPTGMSSGMWRHEFSQTNFLDRELYEGIARTLEQGCFDMMFMPDVLAVPDSLDGSYGPTLQYGAQGALQLDSAMAMVAAASATKYIGLGTTISTTYFPPFQIARAIGTLDHLSGGRAAWNIVTSAMTASAKNFGGDPLPSHSDRYDRGDEVVDAVRRLLSSWEPDALVLDKPNALFADPERIHSVDFEGRQVRVRGPLTFPPSPQGLPVMMQAGASARGLEFAARWGEVIFIMAHTAEDMRSMRATIRSRAAELGRDPEGILVLPAVQAIVGETRSIARERQQYINELVPLPAGLAVLSSHAGVNLSQFDLATPLADVIDALGAPGSVGSIDLLRSSLNAGVSTLGEAARRYGASELTPQFVGVASDIADEMEELITSEACDGFVLTPTELPGSYEQFVRSVVPELQRRGLLRRRYSGSTLRHHLGLPCPQLDPCHSRRDEA